MFTDVWRPLLVALAVSVVVSVAEQLFAGPSRYSIFDSMKSSGYFSAGDLPWRGLGARTVLSAAMLYGAVINVARRDF